MFVADCAQAGGAQQEVAARSRSLDLKPACRQHPDEMTTGKYQDVTLHCAQPVHNPVRSRPDLLGSFATPTAIAKQFPVGPLFKDVGARASFVLSIVPLDEIRIHVGYGAK